MFNNSSAFPFVSENTSSDVVFDKQLSCFLWHLRKKTMPSDRIQDVCSIYDDLLEMGSVANVIWCVIGLFIIIPNVTVLGTILSRKELKKPMYFYMANLALSDILAGVTLPSSVAIRLEPIGLTRLYKLMNMSSLIIYSQMVSASAISMLSVDSYVAIKYPVYFHIHAGDAKRNALVAIVSSWLVLSLFAFSSSMGWNCLDKVDPECENFYPPGFISLIAAIVLCMVSIMLFTNISTFIAIKQRRKRRLGQGGAPQPLQNNINQGQNIAVVGQHQNNAQEETDRKFRKSVRKAGTVMIQVVVALFFWILPLVFIAICLVDVKRCPLQKGPNQLAILWTLNSIINPIASIARTPDLRKGIWQNFMAIHRIVVTVLRRSRTDPLHEQHVSGNNAQLQGRATQENQQQNTTEERSTTGNSPNQNVEESSTHAQARSTSTPCQSENRLEPGTANLNTHQDKQTYKQNENSTTFGRVVTERATSRKVSANLAIEEID
ncbi:sphingosine 1-phosphate receptor 1-like [Branchiostoma lanceolatum]|uniref:sphingosine 1-phosphate receptor 1-like n=1 Tax=Branchiostoma lanceolatum TaxID=7740 RepID=UPI00345541EC